jgi:hypothetical protein
MPPEFNPLEQSKAKLAPEVSLPARKELLLGMKMLKSNKTILT